MTLRHRFLSILVLLLATLSLTGCAVGMLLFYRETKTMTVYKSSLSNKNYYTIKATTLSHCGCTDLNIDYYKNGRKKFNIFYNGNIARKTIYPIGSKKLNHSDTILLMAIPGNNFTIAFDSLDTAIFNKIDSLAVYKPKGIVYEIKRPIYKGYIKHADNH
jgi:hypothetical protein